MLPQDLNLPLVLLAQLRWDVSPVIFHLGPLAIRWYSLGWILAFVMGFLLVQRTYRKEGKPEQDLESIRLHMILGSIIGARLGHCFFYRPDYYLANPLEIIAFWKGFQGLSSHGGTIGILVSLFIFSRRHPDQPYLWLLDRIAAPTALGGFFIRMGNLMNSEILGLPADVPWAVTFVRVDDLPRHPAQLYEALAYVTIFVVLFLMQRRRSITLATGTLTGAFLALVFSARILIELVKERHVPFEMGLPLSMGQILSIPLVFAGLSLIWWVRGGRAKGASPG